MLFEANFLRLTITVSFQKNDYFSLFTHIFKIMGLIILQVQKEAHSNTREGIGTAKEKEVFSPFQ